MPEADALQKLIGRLEDQHPKKAYLERELHRQAAGVRGEERLAAKFQEFYIPEEFTVLRDVRLGLGEWRVQMDALLLTNRCAVIVESKNISGELHFDNETDEFYRIGASCEKTVFEHPAVQLEKNRYFLEQWFRQRGILLPVEGAVVFTSRQCEFITKPTSAVMCKLYQMPQTLRGILKIHSPGRTASLQLAREIIPLHQIPYERKPLCERYQLSPDELKKGIFCSRCGLLAVTPMKRSWICRACGEKQQDVQTEMIREYFSLVSRHASNREFRRFYRIDSIMTVSRILGSCDLKAEGEKRGRTYSLHSYE